MPLTTDEELDSLKKDIFLAEEHIMEAMRSFFIRINDYQKEFEQHNNYEVASCIVDNIFSEIETIQQHRELYLTAKRAVRKLDKIVEAEA